MAPYTKSDQGAIFLQITDIFFLWDIGKVNSYYYSQLTLTGGYSSPLLPFTQG
jgi:hypothetical protein